MFKRTKKTQLKAIGMSAMLGALKRSSSTTGEAQDQDQEVNAVPKAQSKWKRIGKAAGGFGNQVAHTKLVISCFETEHATFICS
jgi:hypothetical protein